MVGVRAMGQVEVVNLAGRRAGKGYGVGRAGRWVVRRTELYTGSTGTLLQEGSARCSSVLPFPSCPSILPPPLQGVSFFLVRLGRFCRHSPSVAARVGQFMVNLSVLIWREGMGKGMSAPLMHNALSETD